VDEERVGVAVDDAVARVRDGRGGEPDHVLAGGGDRVRHRGREEAGGGRAEHAEEGVHQYLGRLRRDRVTRRPGAGALQPQARYQLGEDARLVAPEGRAAGVRTTGPAAGGATQVSGAMLQVRVMLG